MTGKQFCVQFFQLYPIFFFSIFPIFPIFVQLFKFVHFFLILSNFFQLCPILSVFFLVLANLLNFQFCSFFFNFDFFFIFRYLVGRRLVNYNHTRGASASSATSSAATASTESWISDIIIHNVSLWYTLSAPCYCHIYPLFLFLKKMKGKENISNAKNTEITLWKATKIVQYLHKTVLNLLCWTNTTVFGQIHSVSKAHFLFKNYKLLKSLKIGHFFVSVKIDYFWR